MSDVKLTSVKLISELYKKFKNETIESEFSLQKLVNRTIDKFVYDEDFRDIKLKHENLHQSGRKF